MLIIPAINIKNGQCVSVSNHQISDAKAYSDDLADVVGRWFDSGVKRLHLVDLDGALEGHAVNSELLCQIAFRFPNLSMQVSGGVRTLVDIETYLKAGLDYVVLGTKAFEDPEFVLKASSAFPGQIMISIDAKDGKVLLEGRTKEADLDVLSFANKFDQSSIAGLIYSDISPLVYGINIDAITKLASLVTIPVIASGGIEDMDDIRALYAESHKGIVGAISASVLVSARAKGNGHLNLLEAQAYCDEFED
jgi:phosphoribosylformimino-5-aminoimidazole carboxamide ribotide isomerase